MLGIMYRKMDSYTCTLQIGRMILRNMKRPASIMNLVGT